MLRLLAAAAFLMFLTGCDRHRPPQPPPEFGVRSPAPSASSAIPLASGSLAPPDPLPPPPPGPLLVEAEDFLPEGGGWFQGAWGDNYFSGSFANTFLSRKAFLGAAPGTGGAVARKEVWISTPGRYLPLVRYEYPYRFAATFRLRIEQGGNVLLDRVYGQRRSRKVWAFRSGVTEEKVWPWGSSENLVWEGQENPVELAEGPVMLSLVTEADPPPAARRHVDAILLTTDQADVEERIAKEGHLPLDG
ncbi:MAG: hypothetical protein RMJ98_01855, partial [Myxococcales bacterium]|nr:hypothetical protein [Polyangiaceae bacterium]MDW8248032.1 hypothetical protein [Myxococcales bacterium]